MRYKWLEKIPEHWQVTRIKRKCKLIGSGTTPNTSNNLFYNGNIYWIQSGDLYNHDYINSTEKLITRLALDNNSALTCYEPPFVVIAMYGASIGNVSISNISACVNQACCVLIPDDDVNVRYMYYWVKFCREDFLRQSSGGTQPNISQKKIREELFILPPRSEQDSIVRYLDDRVAKVNRLIEAYEREVKLLDELKKTAINEAVTHGLDSNAPMKDSGVKWLGEIPEHWNMSKAKHHVIITNGTNPTSEGDIPVYGSGTQPFTTCGEYKEGPAVLLGRKGSIGNVTYIEGRYWNIDTAFSVTTIGNDLAISYYYYLATRFPFDFYMTRTAIPSMTQTDYYNMYIPVPPLSEQQAIAKYLDEKCSKIDRAINLKQKQIKLWQEYKTRLISDVVTGQLDIRGVNDNGNRYE